jgi:4-carboxymuconolactone decarboxylase
MARSPKIPPELLSPEQQRLCDQLFEITGHPISGPFAPLLPAPHVAAAAVQMLGAFRSKRKLELRLFELMVLIIARHWNSQVEWHTHMQRGLDAGLSAAAVDALRNRQIPQFAREDERMVYDVITELNEKRTLGAETFNKALTVLKDRELVVELIAGAGFYTMIAIILNSFEVPIPAGKVPI